MFDFLIIGGGIAGISAAARLSSVGSVQLCETEDALGYHASGRSAALFEETYGKPSTIELNKASYSYHKDENGGVLSPRGLMLIGRKDEKEAFETDCGVMAMHPISIIEACSKIPVLNTDTVAYAAYHEDAQDIDTDLLLQNFARTARRNGAQIATKAGVTSIDHLKPGWRVTTHAGAFEAKLIVNAAGAWVDDIATMAGVRPLGLSPLKRSMARIPAPGGHDTRSWPMLFGTGESWYAKPDAGKLLVSPADEELVTPHDAWADDMVLAEGLAKYEEMVTEPVTRLESSWAGLRTFAPDRCLVIGHDTQVSDFFWLAGQGGYGMQTSPAASQLAADLIAGRVPEIDKCAISALSPARFD
ncbi:NAD(P)/FAD-dependent oxidoreductase [Cochlodiniinecator piscidefendens]|uniref:NAD(P)/FAD-dependent oxidoreductase n=1 Tax=Cochlodiniinecator piscidefendens TaxID=2715756 RepID=UPI00140A7259|nr:FAD-binding oxidoreductase [Cochlodiniinecator piscidefendens]